MADSAWVFVHSYDPQVEKVVPTYLQEQDISRVHPYDPAPGSWHDKLHLITEIHLRNGSLIHVTESFTAVGTAMKVKAV